MIHSFVQKVGPAKQMTTWARFSSPRQRTNQLFRTTVCVIYEEGSHSERQNCFSCSITTKGTPHHHTWWV